HGGSKSLLPRFHEKVSGFVFAALDFFVNLNNECTQRVLITQVYALTRERDTLRKEQNKRCDAIAPLKEKDKITTQVMAEGEELSKKQSVQESTTRKLRAHVHIKIYYMIFIFKNLTVSHRLSNASSGSQTVSDENRGWTIVF
nr:golgin candidate 5 [Tanacetum cinerariifolium]